MMLNLKDREWKEFSLDKLFEIYSTSSSIDRNKLNVQSGKIPYITRSEKNNGYDIFIQPQDAQYKIDKANTITIGLDTQTVFFQPYPFYTGQNIQILYNKWLNKYVSLYLIPLIIKQMDKFNWGGNGATLSRLKRSKIFLPITVDRDPDYDFMEQYIRQKEKRSDVYIDIIRRRLSKIKSTSIVSLSEKEWGEFFISDIFSLLQRGKRLKRSDHLRGNIPYISSTFLNNGVDGFIGNKENVRIFKDCLTLANSGSVGTCFFQPFQIVASDHVTKLENKDFNKYVYLFISNMVSRLSEKYSFNREINDLRIKREKIMLPIDSKGKPDYQYMEQYMMNLEYTKLKSYMNYKNQ